MEPPLPPMPELPAMVARTVGKSEAASNEKCIKAVDDEWKKLTNASIWIESEVREWRDVKAEAAHEGREIHVGNLHELIVEKGSELKVDDPIRKMKGRVVSLATESRMPTAITPSLRNFPLSQPP